MKGIYDCEKSAPKHIQPYFKEFQLSEKFFSILPGAIEISNHQYELWAYRESVRFSENEVCILFYPHKTSNDNYHVRVRNHGSKNKIRVNIIMELLGMMSNNCTFTRKISNND